MQIGLHLKEAEGRERAESAGSLAQRLEQERGCGRRDIQRLDHAELRKRDKAIAAIGYAGTKAFPLTAENEDGGAGQVGGPRRLFRLGIGTPDPEARLLRF